MTIEIFLQGLGVACAIATSGFLLGMGWHIGIIAGAWLAGPHHTETKTTINHRYPADTTGQKA